ncbi:MAG: aspartate carbamoyltransferase [Myxococcales bacterium]|nr:aspartate carbamoyltransferase [Myxococcales bacterium]
MAFAGRDLTDIHRFTADELRYVLAKSHEIKTALQTRNPAGYCLADQRDLLAALLFYENSTRTRTSFEIAAMRLGMRTTGFASMEGTSVSKGESLRHTLDMYEAYLCDCVIMRHPLDGSARFAAEHLQIPVFNAGDGKHEHPTQTILDLFTIQEHIGRLHDLDVGVSGDLKYGRTAHSLVVALTKFPGNRVHLFSHPDLALPKELIRLAQESGAQVIEHDSMEDIVAATDILYQTRIQKERMPDLSEFDKAKARSQFSLKMMQLTRPHFGLMHPLPIDKTAPSITTEVDAHPKALYKRQAGNGVPTRLTELALSLNLLGSDFAGERWQEPSEDDIYFEEREIRNSPVRENLSILPIRTNGVVIDHMAPYTEDLLLTILKVRQRRDIYRAATVKSRSRPDSIKGMLMIENRTLTDDDLRAIASVSPGCTVNTIENAQVIRKQRLQLPNRIQNVPGMMCTNKGCISRPEHLEAVMPKMLRTASHSVRCHYCDEVMDISQIVNTSR